MTIVTKRTTWAVDDMTSGYSDATAYLDPDADTERFVIQQGDDSVWLDRIAAKSLAEFIGETFP